MAVSINEAIGYLNDTLEELNFEGYTVPTVQAGGGNDAEVKEALQKIAAASPYVRNQIMKQMNLIVQARNYGVMFDSSKNPMREFLVGLEEGFGIEDIFHELIDGIDPLWDGNGTTDDIVNDLYSYDTNKIDKCFHVRSEAKEFKTSIDRRNYEKVFLPNKITRYVDTKLANLSWSAEVWLQNVIAQETKKMVDDRDLVFLDGYNVSTEEGVTNVVEAARTVISGFQRPSKLYNKGALQTDGSYTPVTNITNKDDIFIVTTPQYFERLKVRGYANAFNLSQYEIEGRILYLPNGTDLGSGRFLGEKVMMIILDRRAILAGIKTWAGTSNFIENTLVMNHYLLVEMLVGHNTFFNAVAISGKGVDTWESATNGYNVTVKHPTAGSSNFVGFKFIKPDGSITESVGPTNTEDFETNVKTVIATINGTGTATVTLTSAGMEMAPVTLDEYNKSATFHLDGPSTIAATAVT